MFSDYKDEEAEPGSLMNFPLNRDTNMRHSPPLGEGEDMLADMQQFSRPPLRSRPAIDFSELQSTVGSSFGLRPPTDSSGQSTIGSDFNYSATVYSQPRSQVSARSGSTSHSSLKPQPLYPPNPSQASFDTSRLHPTVIAALTVAQLGHNHHYCELRQKHDDMAAVVTAYMKEKLKKPQVSNSDIVAPVVPTIYQGAFLFAPAKRLTQHP